MNYSPGGNTDVSALYQKKWSNVRITSFKVKITSLRSKQGSQRSGKSWKTWKMKYAFSRPGKIMEFEKKAKIMEKSWNFKISTVYGKIMEKDFGVPRILSNISIYWHIVKAIITVITFIMSIIFGYKEMQGDHIQSTIVCFVSVKISHCRSWKNDARVMENHGKFMEFDSAKVLGTLSKL